MPLDDTVAVMDVLEAALGQVGARTARFAPGPT
jgi:hypothetical protein